MDKPLDLDMLEAHARNTLAAMPGHVDARDKLELIAAVRRTWAALFTAGLRIEDRIREHADPHGEAEEQYVAGLRDALTALNEAHGTLR